MGVQNGNRTGKTNNAETRRRADVAYDEILRLMALGRFDPNRRITEPMLCEMLNMSRTPVREAVNRLTSAGLLVGEPHRGVRLRALTIKDLLELLDVREAIEVEAARLLAPKITDEQLALLDEICEAMNGPEKSKYELQGRDIEFHMNIIEFSGNSMLLDVYQRYHLLQMSILGYNRAALYLREAWGDELGDQHKPIVRALAERDPVIADAGAREAMRLARENYLKALKLMEEREQVEKSEIAAVVERLAPKKSV